MAPTADGALEVASLQQRDAGTDRPARGKRVKAAFYFHIHLFARDEIGGVRSIISAGAGAPPVPFGFAGEPFCHIVWVRTKNGRVTTERIKDHP